jgi:tetratricopeptide (TPR) repeat protein
MNMQLLFRRGALVSVGAWLTAGVLAAQTPRPTPTPTPTPVQVQAGGRGGAPSEAAQIQAVRVALGHGQVAEARKLSAAPPTAAGRDMASALIDVFEGKDEDARTKLAPLASVNRYGDAALELGLLDMRHGQRDAGRRLLDPIAAVRTFAGPDDYFRLARAARAIREFLLANDAYLKIQTVERADIQTEWGDVFFQRHQPAEAVTNYKKALEIDPRWVPAMLGLARALADEAPDQADAAMSAVEKLAPTHPDLWLLAADLQIDREERTSAAASLDKVAAARPGTVDEAALRAQLAYAAKDSAAVDAALARVKAVDPFSALGYRRIGQQAAHDYRFDEAVRYATQATTTDADDPYAFFELGLYQMRAGDEKSARTALERSWAFDKSAPVTKNLLDVLDHIDAMDTVVDGDLIFKFAKNEAAVLQTYAIPLAREAMAQFKERYAFTPQGPILVEVFPKHDDFAVRTLGLPGLVGALGACFGRVVSMDSPSARPPGEFSWQATLWHELAHVYTLQSSKYRVPRWLTEGISVYEEHRRQPAWGRELALQFASALNQGKTFGVKKLPDAFKQPENLALAYFEAALLVEHLVAINGDQGLRTLLAAYADGLDDNAAFARAFGRSVDEVETSFKAFVTQQYGPLSKAMAQPTPKVAPDDVPALRQRASQAPDNFWSQMSLGAALMRTGDHVAARAPLEKAAQLAPQASGDDSPRSLLAIEAIDAGDPARARRELRQLLTYDHTNVLAARRLLAAAGNAPDAVDDRDYALQLIADLDPFDAGVHAQLGRRLYATGKFAPALIEFRAALSLGPPNLAESHTELGETLFKLGRKDEAKRQAILALEQAPTFARAQDLLLAILGRH